MVRLVETHENNAVINENLDEDDTILIVDEIRLSSFYQTEINDETEKIIKGYFNKIKETDSKFLKVNFVNTVVLPFIKDSDMRYLQSYFDILPALVKRLNLDKYNIMYLMRSGVNRSFVKNNKYSIKIIADILEECVFYDDPMQAKRVRLNMSLANKEPFAISNVLKETDFYKDNNFIDLEYSHLLIEDCINDDHESLKRIEMKFTEPDLFDMALVEIFLDIAINRKYIKSTFDLFVSKFKIKNEFNIFSLYIYLFKRGSVTSFEDSYDLIHSVYRYADRNYDMLKKANETDFYNVLNFLYQNIRYVSASGKTTEQLIHSKFSNRVAKEMLELFWENL